MPRRLELEDALGLAALEDLEGLGIVEREAFEVDRRPRDAAALMSRTAAARVVRLRRPRKSIFRSPAFSMSPISHWVVTTSLALSLLGSFWSGTSSSSGRSAITTPAACVPTLRFIPSSRRAKSSSRATSGSSSASRRSAGSSLIASSSVMLSRAGTSLLICSTRASGMFSARPTSLIAALALSVPKVPICATLASPYFLRTYSMTS